MTTMTPDEADAVWSAIDDQRERTAALLEQLTAAQWDHPSLCEGWTVRHVAAHLTTQRERIRDAVAFVVRHPRILRGGSLNATIHDSAVVQAGVLSEREIVATIRGMIGSRRHNAFVTPLETLTDILVHSQDIAHPLRLGLDLRPAAGAMAATRRWDTRGTWLATVNRRLALEGYHLTATDTAWSRGQGPEVAGPVGALLLMLTGRPAGLEQLTGAGADELRSVTARPV
ncbi:maleylpyruvate isomerase family mycothiol-dependent enzyme [Fodinibacter luteus]|uniref:Maleylpyruvate isomerase family mycothiol-dependent enzyme n=1 Tax=Fodinibacter luteus TaxID=552064 RepID=A0ABP8KPW3_9MICO